jgi:hypothetical protein
MIFKQGLRVVDAGDCLHFNGDKHKETKGKTQWKKLRHHN